MKPKKLKFVAHESKDKVSALYCRPKNPKALVVLGHGAGAGMTHSKMESIASGLFENEIASFRYQFPFMERGGGRDSKEVSLSTVRNAVLKAHELDSKLPLFAGGNSFGGRMTTMAAAELGLPKVVGLILYAFPLHPSGKPSVDRADHLFKLKLPMLFLSGTRDKLFTLDLFAPILKKLGRKAKLHTLETADHGFKILKRTRTSKEDVFDEVARVASQWISKKA